MSMYGYGGGYGGGGGGSRFNLRIIIGVIIAVIGVVSYYTRTSINPVTGEKQHVSMTPTEETTLGLQAAPEMAAQMGGEVPPDDPEAQEVRYVGNTIWHNSDAARSPYQYNYHLLADPNTINAFALPGGQVFITRGLYEKLKDEAELAGVLGHETGHVVERHSAQQVEKGQLGQSLVTAVAVGASDRRNGLSTAMIANMVNQVTQLKFSREDESQADEQGLKYMAQAGYDPRAMIDVMKVLMSISQGGRQPEFLVTHPYPEHRIVDIEAELKRDYANGFPSDLTRGKALPRG
jgi:beta-barrel assembly-enhancing protease